MADVLKDRVLNESWHIINTGDTIRQTAKKFHISKSTVGYDVCYRLKDINFILYLKVKKILFNNFNQKHINGGNSTANKYKKINN